MIPDSHTAGICGLFCGTCPMYPNQCHGCLSDKVAAHCRTCHNGFRECAKAHGATRCFECADFPCARLQNFVDSHWENGISHHEGVINNLQRMKEIGVDAWVTEQSQKAQCPRCGQLVCWHTPHCECEF